MNCWVKARSLEPDGLVYVLTLLLACCGTWHKSPNLSVPQVPHLRNKDGNHSIFTQMLRECDQFLYIHGLIFDLENRVRRDIMGKRWGNFTKAGGPVLP